MNEAKADKGNPADAPINRLSGGTIPADIQALLTASAENPLRPEDVQRVKKYIATREGDESLQARALRFVGKYKFSAADQAVASGSGVDQRRPAMEETSRKVPLSIGQYQLAVCGFLDARTHDPSLIKGKKNWRVHPTDNPLTITQLDYPLLKEGFTKFASQIVIADGGEMHTDWQPDYEGILGSFRRRYRGDHGWKELFLRPDSDGEELYHSYGLRCISYTKGKRIDLKFTYPDQSQFL